MEASISMYPEALKPLNLKINMLVSFESFAPLPFISGIHQDCPVHFPVNF